MKREQIATTIGCTTESLRRWYVAGKKQGLVTKPKGKDDSATPVPATAEPAATSAPHDPARGSKRKSSLPDPRSSSTHSACQQARAVERHPHGGVRRDQLWHEETTKERWVLRLRHLLYVGTVT
ncbi:MAG TPA: hypothetical protein VHN14_36315, partial [Kofleriaceae bacterium]|nr:hypothetical protein [Kofleriaceae bacterium]